MILDYNSVVELVYSARSIALRPFSSMVVSEKQANDFVTNIDLDINNYLKKELNQLYPYIGFLTEEEPGQLSSTCFILDPIDGTTNLIRDYRMSSISLALYHEGEAVFGVVFNPFNKEMFFAIKGKGAYCFDTSFGIGKLLKIGVSNYQQSPLSCSKREAPQSLLEFGAGSSNKENADANFALAKSIFLECLDIRRVASTALTICYIAAGRLDGYFERIIKPWDYAAASIILAEAGGKSTDWSGAPLPFSKPGTIISSNGVIHDFLLKKVALA
ncbi:MAG: inositol monophosphatase family protein [Clostridia bacterium]